MKMQIPLSLIGGACVGAVATFSAMRNREPASGVAVVAPTERPEHVGEEDESNAFEDPFADPSEGSFAVDLDSGEASAHPHGDTKMDMSNVFQRDLCISFWYMDMNTVVDRLELHTGHKFEKQVGKVYASPVEILEEQAAFLKSFEEETRRIEAAADSDPDIKSETE